MRKQGKAGKGGNTNVIDFAKCKARRDRQFTDLGVKEERPLLVAMDEATRDLHAAASTTLKLLYLARSRMGLPDI